MPPEHDVLPHHQRRARRPVASQPLRRVQKRVLGGVAGGVAKFIGTNPLIVRLIFVLVLFLTMGILGIVYMLLWLFLPRD